MKLQDSSAHRNKRIIIITSIVIAVLIASAATAYFVNKNSQSNTTQTSPTIDANKSDEALEGNEKPIDGSTDDEKVIVPTEPENNNSTSLEAATITRASQDGDRIRIAAIFNQPAYGTCELRIEKTGETTITASSAIVVGASYYSCDGFMLQRNEFSNPGTWEVTVIHKSSSGSIKSEAKNITIK